MARSTASKLDPSHEELFFSGAAQATRFFMGNADVQRTVAKLAHDLDEDGVPYALIGAMALNAYGYRRMTVDVDVLVTSAGLAAFKERRLGRGYVERFAGSRGLRDTENGVAIDFVLAGDYPGDGKPKPVRFPDPGEAALRGEHVALLPLPKLIELKLASGMSAPHRLKDLADVLELVRAVKLPETLGGELDPSVREKYRELWAAAQAVDEDDRR